MPQTDDTVTAARELLDEAVPGWRDLTPHEFRLELQRLAPARDRRQLKLAYGTVRSSLRKKKAPKPPPKFGPPPRRDSSKPTAELDRARSAHTSKSSE